MTRLTTLVNVIIDISSLGLLTLLATPDWRINFPNLPVSVYDVSYIV